MDNENKASKMHPLTAAAAIALILACLVGIAAMLGILPTFNKTTPPPVTSTEPIGANAPAPAVAAAPVSAPVAEEQPEPEPAPKVVHKKTVKKPVKKPVPTISQPPENNQYSQAAPPYCPNCGEVESVRTIEQQAPASGLGAGVGAVVGGLLGNQVGSGNGRTLATIAGAVGGGYAGNAIEQNRHLSISYEVIVRMDNGGRQRFIMREQRWRSGDLVRVENGQLVAI